MIKKSPTPYLLRRVLRSCVDDVLRKEVHFYTRGRVLEQTYARMQEQVEGPGTYIEDQIIQEARGGR